MDVREKLVELLDNFHHDLSPFAGNEKLFMVDDNIEQAEYLIANGVTVQEWISVKDRLPKPFETVFVYDSTRKQIADAYLTRHNEWVGVRIRNEVTHWMPMPEPPKGEQ